MILNVRGSQLSIIISLVMVKSIKINVRYILGPRGGSSFL